MAQMKLWELGFQHVAGVDEAGRGPLAGPVVAAACIIPASVIIAGKISNFCVTASGLETSSSPLSIKVLVILCNRISSHHPSLVGTPSVPN